MTDDIVRLWKIPRSDPELGTPIEFWNSTKRWPQTPIAEGVVFLPVAMHRIARATYSDWHSREPWMPVPPPEFMPRNLDTRAIRHISDARQLLANFSDGFKPAALTNYEMATLDRQGAVDDVALLPLSEDEWASAHAVADQLRDFVGESRKRWTELVEGTFAYLRIGRLECFLRPRAGGAYVPAPAGIWNTELEQVAGRFAFGDLDLARPFDAAARSMINPHRIFVTLPSLDRLLADIAVYRDGGQVEPAVQSTVVTTEPVDVVVPDDGEHDGSPIKRVEDPPPTKLRQLLCEYLITQHEGQWPTAGLSEQVRDFLTWVRGVYGETTWRKFRNLQKSTLSRFKSNRQEFAKTMQWVRDQTQR